MSKVKPSNCPIHDIAPQISCYELSRFQRYWRCRCPICDLHESDGYGKIEQEYSRFGYGAESSYSEDGAIRNWNSIVKRYYARIIKDSVKVRTQRSLDEELKKTRLEKWQINKVLKATKAYELLRAAVE